MDNARDEPLIVQLWLDLEKCFGWDRVGVVFASSTVTVSLDVTLCERLKGQKRFLKYFSHGLYSFLVPFYVLFPLKNSLNLIIKNRFQTFHI